MTGTIMTAITIFQFTSLFLTPTFKQFPFILV
jgi:hypothetical protein